ncbi:hypothetical protein V1477_005648 [Vespula maculifrons]|uniref:Uncharacterized protein n=1 Tax=Vespula maculifrons TaxID=7453 RepID=A0ABD2CQ77_VESMC
MKYKIKLKKYLEFYLLYQQQSDNIKDNNDSNSNRNSNSNNNNNKKKKKKKNNFQTDFVFGRFVTDVLFLAKLHVDQFLAKNFLDNLFSCLCQYLFIHISINIIIKYARKSISSVVDAQ